MKGTVHPPSLSFSSLLHSLPGANELLMAVEQWINPPLLPPLSFFFLSSSLLPPVLPFCCLLLAFWQAPSLSGSHSPPSLFVSRFWEETEWEAWLENCLDLGLFLHFFFLTYISLSLLRSLPSSPSPPFSILCSLIPARMTQQHQHQQQQQEQWQHQ